MPFTESSVKELSKASPLNILNDLDPAEEYEPIAMLFSVYAFVPVPLAIALESSSAQHVSSVLRL